jgi:hypothetical protein
MIAQELYCKPRTSLAATKFLHSNASPTRFLASPNSATQLKEYFSGDLSWLGRVATSYAQTLCSTMVFR